MTSNFKFVGLLLGLSMLSACGAGGGGSASNTGGGGGGGGSTSQGSARETLSFAIPIGSGHATGTPNSRGTAAVRKPDFVDANSDGAFTIMFDGTTIGPITFAPDGQGNVTITEGETGPTGSGTLPKGGSYSYTSTYTYTNSQGSSSGNQAYADISLTFTTIPGSHTIGIVQTNGACDSGLTCISNTNGYVLAEGQTTVFLQPGTNAPTTLVLKGVMESMYFCDAACDGQAGTYSASGYTISAFVADESGDAIPYQLDSTGAVVPFDNGSYEIIENDVNGIVTITQPSSTGIYTSPGTDDISGIYGENITIACNKVGSTTVVAELLSTDPSSGSVAGYTYTNDYPAPGSILSSVGADESFGNELSVSCSTTDSITVQQKSRQS